MDGHAILRPTCCKMGKLSILFLSDLMLFLDLLPVRFKCFIYAALLHFLSAGMLSEDVFDFDSIVSVVLAFTL